MFDLLLSYLVVAFTLCFFVRVRLVGVYDSFSCLWVIACLIDWCWCLLFVWMLFWLIMIIACLVAWVCSFCLFRVLVIWFCVATVWLSLVVVFPGLFGLLVWGLFGRMCLFAVLLCLLLVLVWCWLVCVWLFCLFGHCGCCLDAGWCFRDVCLMVDWLKWVCFIVVY